MLLQNKRLIPEVSFPNALCPNPEDWRCYDGEGTEYEVLNLLTSLVETLKPKVIVETGTYLGYGTVSLARGAARNGYGSVYTCDLNNDRLNWASDLLQAEGLRHLVTLHNCPGKQMIEAIYGGIDFAFLDSHMTVRVREAAAVLPRLTQNGVIVVHDTSVNHAVHNGGPRYGLNEFATLEGLQLVHFNTPRGVSILKRP